jgi:hypothetical protein
MPARPMRSGRQPAISSPAKRMLPAWRLQAADGAQGRRLAHAVAAEQGGRFAFRPCLS